MRHDQRWSDMKFGAMSVRQIAHVLGALEIAKCPASARMYHACLVLARDPILTSIEACISNPTHAPGSWTG